MKLYCPTCGSAIPAADMNLESMVAKCAACNAVFRFDGELAPAAPREELPVPLPNGVVMEQNGSELQITRRWLSAKFFFLVFFCLVWDGFLVVWFGIALASKIWMMAAFATGHALIGLFLSYYTVAGFLNRTRIGVSHAQIAVRHGPLPWWGNKRLETSDVAQLYCKETITRSRGTTNASFSLHAMLRSGGEQKLLADLDNSEQALYFEQEIERYLGITNVPVRGEMAR